jgi:hypothetical protein
MNCYRFQSRAQFRTLAAAEGLLTEDGELITASHAVAIDEVGIIATGDIVLSGWHVNVVGDLAPEAWDRYLVVVNHPARVFFGGATQAPDTATLEAIA